MGKSFATCVQNSYSYNQQAPSRWFGSFSVGGMAMLETYLKSQVSHQCLIVQLHVGFSLLSPPEGGRALHLVTAIIYLWVLARKYVLCLCFGQ